MNIYLYLKMFPYLGNELNDGAVRAVHGLATGLVTCGVKVTVLCEGANDSSYKTDAGYEIKCFANPRKHLTFKIATNLQKYIQNCIEPGLVILNGLFHPSVYSVSRLLQQQKIPYIVAPHNPYSPAIFGKNPHLKLPYWYLLERRMLSQAKAIQVLDIRQADWLRRLGVKTPVIEVPNGFLLSDVCPESTLQWREDGVPSLSFLGRIDTYNKGLDILLDAFVQVTKETNAQLVIQGPDKGNRKALENRATELSVSEKVFFLEPDFVTSPSLILAKHDIFCLPSRFEGFSLAALEAMLAGRVLLVSEAAGIAPHIKASGCGVVVKPEVSAVKAGLIELLRLRSSWQEMGLAGRRYVLENLQWCKIASTALEHYKKGGVVKSQPSRNNFQTETILTN